MSIFRIKIKKILVLIVVIVILILLGCTYFNHPSFEKEHLFNGQWDMLISN